MWSGPRNLSTAMMRSFGARADCAVWDEPFFAPYLAVSGKPHPGRTETLAAHETDPHKVAARCDVEVREAYHFLKLMPHHMLTGFPMDWADDGRHFFLLRNPTRVIASYARGRVQFDVDDLGFAAQRILYDKLSDSTGRPIAVIDSADILRAPEPALSALCDALDIRFDPAMLSWAKGTRAEDGAWAPYWYKSVENSTGFAPYHDEDVKLTPAQTEMHTACADDYQYLADKALHF